MSRQMGQEKDKIAILQMMMKKHHSTNSSNHNRVFSGNFGIFKKYTP